MKDLRILALSAALSFVVSACGGGGGGGGGGTTTPAPTSATTPTPTAEPTSGSSPTPTTEPTSGSSPTPTVEPSPGTSPTAEPSPTGEPVPTPEPTPVSISAKVSWDIPDTRTDGETLLLSDIGGYEVMYKMEGASDFETAVIDDGTISEYLVEDIPAGDYEVKVRAFDTNDLYSDFSPSITSTITP